MRLRDTYNIPSEIVDSPHSKAFETFLWNWFGDPLAVSRHELDLTFLNDLKPDELRLARQLIRRNLELKQIHIIEGASALRDTESVPMLQKMVGAESDESRKLTIAGALWKLSKDPLFVELLNQAKSNPDGTLIRTHIQQILWLDDDRAIDLLIDLLDHPDWKVGTFALDLLNTLEHGLRFPNAASLPTKSNDYRRRRDEPTFRAQMVAAVRRRNAAATNGA